MFGRRWMLFLTGFANYSLNRKTNPNNQMGDRFDSTRIQSCHFGNKEKKGRDLMQLYDKHPLGIRGVNSRICPPYPQRVVKGD